MKSFKWIFIIILFSFVSLSNAEEGQVATFYYVKPNMGNMYGVIGSTTYDDLKNFLARYPQVTKINMVYVPGSEDDEVNIKSARYLRYKKINTHIPSYGVVASGGTDFFLAGVQRTIEKGAKVGVHSWAEDMLFYTKTATDYPRDSNVHELYIKFYEDMGVSDSFYWFTINAAQADDIYWMTQDELTEYGLIHKK